MALETSFVTDGDLKSQYAKSAFPSYSRIDFADMLDQGTISEMRVLEKGVHVDQGDLKSFQPGGMN